MEQRILLKIVRSWKICKKPEYREFKCGKCQKYIRKAWHYWLRTGGFETPVHFCNSCRKKLKLPKIKKNYKIFTCDNCGKKMYKAWHIWIKKGKILSEIHFCRECGKKMEFGKKTIKKIGAIHFPSHWQKLLIQSHQARPTTLKATRGKQKVEARAGAKPGKGRGIIKI